MDALPISYSPSFVSEHYSATFYFKYQQIDHETNKTLK